jgi:hypothetical protein
MGKLIQIAALFEPTEGAIAANALRADGVFVAEPDLHLHSIFPDRRLAYGGGPPLQLPNVAMISTRITNESDTQ